MALLRYSDLFERGQYSFSLVSPRQLKFISNCLTLTNYWRSFQNFHGKNSEYRISNFEDISRFD